MEKSVGGRGREDIATVGREGVACRGRRERKKGDFDPLPSRMESLPKGSPSLPACCRLAFCHARTCDLRCVMRRRLICVHPLSFCSAAARWNVRNMRVCTYTRARVLTHAYILHDASPLYVYSLILSERPGATSKGLRCGARGAVGARGKLRGCSRVGKCLDRRGG